MTPTHRTRTRRPPAGPPGRVRLQDMRRLTLRDRHLLAWLAEHYLLSADQIARALFPSPRAAQLRLSILADIGALSRFVDITTGSRQYLYALGPLGMLLHPTCYTDPDRPDARTPRSSHERVQRIIGSPRLSHLLGCNDLFIDLHTHTRHQAGARLVRWWSEQHATAAYALAGIHPDGHGIWHAEGRDVGFFLEHDNGTEPIGTVLGKLVAYQRLAQYGPRYPVLLRVPGRRRETHLLEAMHGVPTLMPVATGIHDDHPAAATWMLTSDPSHRRHLHQLPSDHGPIDAALNPHRPDDPDA